MKKIALFTVALFALAAAVFAKPAKVNGWKDVAKIANKNGMEVASDDVNYYVAKGKGGKDFSIFAINDYDDIKVTLAMSCVGGEIFSKITCVDKETEAPHPVFSMGENDEKCVVVNGGDLSYFFTDEAIANWTVELKNQRSKFLDELAKEFGLVVPKK